MHVVTSYYGLSTVCMITIQYGHDVMCNPGTNAAPRLGAWPLVCYSIIGGFTSFNSVACSSRLQAWWWSHLVQRLLKGHTNISGELVVLTLSSYSCAYYYVRCISLSMLWTLPVLHAANLTKYNWWFDEGPGGLKLNRNYMSEMSKCNTAHPLYSFFSLPGYLLCRVRYFSSKILKRVLVRMRDRIWDSFLFFLMVLY